MSMEYCGGFAAGFRPSTTNNGFAWGTAPPADEYCGGLAPHADEYCGGFAPHADEYLSLLRLLLHFGLLLMGRKSVQRIIVVMGAEFLGVYKQLFSLR